MRERDLDVFLKWERERWEKRETPLGSGSEEAVLTGKRPEEK